jgi:hypothetical protein
MHARRHALLAREIAGLSQRGKHHDHKSQTEQKHTQEQIRPNGCRLFIHFGLASCFLIISGGNRFLFLSLRLRRTPVFFTENGESASTLP